MGLSGVQNVQTVEKKNLSQKQHGWIWGIIDIDCVSLIVVWVRQQDQLESCTRRLVSFLQTSNWSWFKDNPSAHYAFV